MFVFWYVRLPRLLNLRVCFRLCGTLAGGIHLCIRGTCRMPLYYEAKLLFVVWLWHPRSKGAVYLYQHSLQPLLLAHEQTIDRKIEEFKAMGGDFVAGNFSK